jgi:PKD repeat protein
VNGTATFQVTLTTVANTPAWVYYVVVVVSTGSGFHTFVLAMIVNALPPTAPFPDYSLTQNAPAGTLTIAPGSSAIDTITMTAQNGFTEPVTLDAKVTPSGGATISFGGGVNLGSEAVIQYTGTFPGTVGLTVSLPIGASGTYLVIVQANGGHQSTLKTRTLVLFINPTAFNAASFTFVKSGLSATFTGATTSGVAPFTYTWSFGDGGPASTIPTNSVTHAYAVAGTYLVGLTVTDATGTLRTAATQSVTVP